MRRLTSGTAGKQRAFNAAFSDFFMAPTLANPVGFYDGQANAILGVDATNNYELKEVKLTIVQSNGTVVEQGNAILQLNDVSWSYTCSSTFANPQDCILQWSASDWAGNTVFLEV